ncbi:ABC transporter permease [Frisingicoccus sp.]|uniref:ABC transporter permease n=1 Tax=Frisingicoccus sp. TaxID=1918627 RepID=UPI002E7747E8|nr:ABC transporter permease [Frisingicoccus sp.]MEE0752267.1 ABC transporter permease [Frisingicoccus sp.]
MENIKKQLMKEHRQLRIRKFCKNRMAVIGMIITLFMTVLALFAPLIATHDPLEMVVIERLKAPSAQHLFGTDTFGRDLFSRVAYGARLSMGVGLSVGVLTMVAGMIIGLYACYYKALDNILMRICDGLKAIPSILLAITMMAVIGPSTKNVIISLTLVSIPGMARIARSNALSIKQQTYIEAMRALGAKPTRIIWGHIAPNVLSPVIVQASYVFATAIITEAALSFLGAGVPAPAPSWGNILYEGKTVIYNSWWMVTFPGVFTALSVLGLNLFGDGLRDFLDPLTS